MRKLTISEIQAVELDNLQIIDRICQEQDLTYYLAYGTLLGAVRNQDFIPWDDDTDIWMPRRDYEAFIAYCEKDLPALYRIATRENSPGYPYGLARFSNQDYEFVSTKPAEQFSAGIFTDIYPLDENGSSYPVARQLYRRCKLVNMAYYAYAATWPQNFLTKSAHRLYKKAVDRIWGEGFAQAVDEKIQRIIFAKTPADYFCQNKRGPAEGRRPGLAGRWGPHAGERTLRGGQVRPFCRVQLPRSG